MLPKLEWQGIITVDRDPAYAPCSYLLCKVFGPTGRYEWETRNEEMTLIVQSDWDFPSVASSFGFVPCPCGNTDGTVSCSHKTATEMITEAGEFLDALCETSDKKRFIQDPGYFENDNKPYNGI